MVRAGLVLFAVACAALAGCARQPSSVTAAEVEPPPAAVQPAGGALYPGMPDYVSPNNVYAAAGAGMLRADVAADKELVYVPNTNSDEVFVIDPATYKIVARFPGADEPQHVVPAYDMRTLFVTGSRIPGGTILPIDPRSGKP